MSQDVKYETTEDVLSTDYEDEAVVVHLDSKRCFRLNDTAAAIWRGVAEGLCKAEMLARLREAYEVDEETAAVELDGLLSSLLERRLIRQVPGGEGSSGAGRGSGRRRG